MQKVLVPLVAALCLGFLGFVFYLFTQDEKKTNPQAQAQMKVMKVPTRPLAAPVLSGPKIGEPAPATKAEDVDGKEFALADYRGKVVVLDFWGFW